MSLDLTPEAEVEPVIGFPHVPPAGSDAHRRSALAVSADHTRGPPPTWLENPWPQRGCWKGYPLVGL